MEQRIDVGARSQLVVDGNNDRGSVYITAFWYGEVPDEVFQRMTERIVEVMKDELGEVKAA